jgi:hemerythrin-like domain-containing protein
MKSPTDILRAEHRVILRSLDLLAAGAERAEGSGAPSEAWWQAMLAWLRGFADRNHHAKEERSLFPAMIKAGLPSEGGPIAVMLEEHVEGRGLIQEMSTAGRRAAAAPLYVSLLRQHIDKENSILFPLADTVLDAEAQHVVGREFEGVELEQGREASLSVAEATLDRLARELDAAP